MRSKPNRPASSISVLFIVAIIAVAFMAVVIMADIIAVVITATAIITAVAGGAMAIATVAGGTKSQRLRNQKRQEFIPWRFFHDLVGQLDDAGF